jgi:hypothetical protein
MPPTDHERPRRGRPEPTDRASSGAITRGLLWVALGVLVAVAVFVLTAPELVGEAPGRALGPLVGVASAAVPGLALLVIAAVRRHRLGLDGDDPPVHPARREGLDDDLGDHDGWRG